MVYQGKVINGVVVFDGPVTPPDGTSVQVEAISLTETESKTVDDALLRMSDLAVDTGVPDLATNIDHYLYGHPKADNGQ
jgi:hypothetical protein